VLLFYTDFVFLTGRAKMNNRTYYRLPLKPKKSNAGAILFAVIIVFALIVGALYYFKDAEVSFALSPSDADILLGDTVLESGARKQIKAGTYELFVSREGFKSFQGNVTLSRGINPSTEVTLEPLEHTFTLNTKPKAAEYTVTSPNGEVKEGKAPFSGVLSSGNVTIEISHDGYETLERDFFHDKEEEVTMHLDPVGQVVHHLFDVPNVPSPKGVAFLQGDTEIWASLLMNKQNGVAVFDAQDGSLIKKIDLAGNGGVEVVFAHDGSSAYVSQMETDTIYEIDTQVYEITRTFKTKSTWCKVMELSHDGKTLYVSNWSGNNISEINLETGEVERILPTIKTPRGLYETADEAYLYVAGFARGELMKIDLETGEGDIIFASNGALRHIVPDEEKGVLYISDMANDELYVHDLNTGETSLFAETDINPNTIVLSPDKKILYVSCRGKNAESSYYVPGPEWGSVLLFDTETGEMLDAIIGGNQPTALAVSHDGSKLVFSNFLDSNLQVYEVPTYEALKKVDGGRSETYKSELKK